MARIRTIKPAFFRSHDVTPLSYRARLTWIGLWTYVDDEGRGRDDARIIKGELWALEDDVTWQEVERDLMELSRSGHVLRYEVSGRQFLAIPTWGEHQVISRPTKSKHPAPEAGLTRCFPSLTDDSVSAPPLDTAGSGSGTGKGNREREQGTAPAALASAFEEAWSHWPKKVERKPAVEKFKIAAKKFGDVDELVAVISRFGDAYARTTDKQMVPALGRWLDRERWDDELPQPRTIQRAPTRGEENLAFLATLADDPYQPKEIAQ